MTAKQLTKVFNLLIKIYPVAHSVDKELSKTFRLVDAHFLSRNPDHLGKFVLQERRRGCKEPFHHWGFMVDKSDVMKAMRSR